MPDATQDQTAPRPHAWRLWRTPLRLTKRRPISPILIRIMAVNSIALFILVGSILYLGQYQDRIIETQLKAMTQQARIFASAVTQNSVVIDEHDQNVLSPLLVRLMVRRLAETAETRTRVFSQDGSFLADSRDLIGTSVKTDPTDDDTEPRVPAISEKILGNIFDLFDRLHEQREYPGYDEDLFLSLDNETMISKALQGHNTTQAWRLDDGTLLLTAVVPMQYSGNQLGVVVVARDDAIAQQAIESVRLNIIQIFCVTFGITFLMSIYLARTLARPIRQLAMAAEQLQQGHSENIGLIGAAPILNANAIPDLTDRDDEIGDLSVALRNLTTALGTRLTAIEHFAADVAHEIKNPLTSLRSAVETATRIKDAQAHQKLMTVIGDDVDRLDRLITDISMASRLDAELSRAIAKPVEITTLLKTLVDLYTSPEHHGGLAVENRVRLGPLDSSLTALGIASRLGQVFQNIIDNALSFSPPDGHVVVSASRDTGTTPPIAIITIDDDGCGIPEGKLDAIFDRFYTERPSGEKFGLHSGLGLSLSKQIVEAHQGKISAENRRSPDTKEIIGARFTVKIPLSS